MKKNQLLWVFATLFVFVAVIFSCQKDEISVNSEDGLSLKQAEVCENNILPTFPGIPDCDEYCIDDEPYVQGTVSFVRQWAQVPQFEGYYKNNKYFTAEAWNDGEKFYVKATVFGYQYDQEKVAGDWIKTGPTCDNYAFNTVLITLDGTSYTFEMDDPATTETVETATEYTAEFLLSDLFPAGWVKCDEIEYTVRLEGDGQPVWLGTADTPENVIYTLFEVCPADCEYTMTALVECEGNDRTTTFTYVAEEDGYLNLQGGLTNWVTNQSLTVLMGTEDVTADFTLIPDVPVQRIKGEIAACETYTFIIDWTYTKTTGDGTKDLGEHEVDEWTATLYEYEIIEDEVVVGEKISEMVTPELMECGDEETGELVYPVEE
ncbi:MAG: hypothetical protein PHH93_08810 [Prolixibacteraceae bacterium]|nr:hypothetical protein [Prolixibacteraceae bacterium]